MSGQGTTAVVDTRERLLDAAERLLEERPIDEVSLRDITAAAGANLAAVNYHFGSKERLLVEVLARRMSEMSAAREGRLRELETRKRKPSVREVVEAFIEPLGLLLHEDPVAGQRHVTLLARLTQSGVDLSSIPTFRDSPGRMLALYRRARPELSPESAARRVAISWATVLEVLGRPLSNGRPTAHLLDLGSADLLDELRSFVIAGLSRHS